MQVGDWCVSGLKLSMLKSISRPCVVTLCVILIAACAAAPPPKLEPTRTTQSIRAVIKQAAVKQKIYQAYQERLVFNDALEGVISYRLTVNPEGQVLSCQAVESTVADTELEQAVRQVLLDAQFGPVADPVPVRFLYPIKFSPTSGMEH